MDSECAMKASTIFRLLKGHAELGEMQKSTRHPGLVGLDRLEASGFDRSDAGEFATYARTLAARAGQRLAALERERRVHARTRHDLRAYSGMIAALCEIRGEAVSKIDAFEDEYTSLDPAPN